MEQDKTKDNTPKNEKQGDKDGIKLNLFSLLGGDILLLPFFRRQLKLILLIILLLIMYISNRYSSQQELREIYSLKSQLIEARYSALASSSELMRRSRQSNVQEALKKTESEVKASTDSPIVIKRSVEGK